MKTLIQVQDEALRRLNVTRSSERRYVKLKCSVRRWYDRELAALGFAPPVMWRMWDDVWDMHKLHEACE